MIRLETRDLTGQPARPLDLIELAVGDPARPARAPLADVCIKSETGGSCHGREAAGFPTVMELAGLEPATSWARFTREPSPPVAIARRLCQPSGSAPRRIATFRVPSSSLLDQNLTSGLDDSRP
jgi:hypothetical protein